MKELNALEYLTGFLMGIIFGVSLESVLFFLFNRVYNLISGTRVGFSWWMIILLVSFPLVSGMMMGKAIASLHLEDY
jgi:ABC-type amino acid transport system permease subunit